VAESESTILIQGETGTGKELLARAIHNLSRRKDKPFLAINCGALPDSLLESELFGYKAGAFTNATKDKPGRFEVAKGGTILLDEIGDISPAFQARLLRVLEEGEFQPLGGVKTLKTNARIIAATNKNLQHLVDRDHFRRDLFYRINVVNLNLPPLRERKEDIPLLVKRFINKMNKLRQRAVTDLDREALKSIINHDFPGNIRELENIIEHAFILCPNGLIMRNHLPAGLNSDITQSPEKISTGKLKKKLKVTEAQTIIDTLKQNNYNRLAAAKALGMHKSTLFRKINKLKIDLPKEDGRSKHNPS